jgi:small subunit ribosomal protein S10
MTETPEFADAAASMFSTVDPEAENRVEEVLTRLEEVVGQQRFNLDRLPEKELEEALINYLEAYPPLGSEGQEGAGKFTPPRDATQVGEVAGTTATGEVVPLTQSEATAAENKDATTTTPKREYVTRAPALNQTYVAERNPNFNPFVAPTALLQPQRHPKTHGIPVAILHFRSYHLSLVDFFTHFVLHSAYSIGIPCSGVAHLPNKRSLYTVIRSPFAHKKSQENFVRLTHKRAIKLWDANPEVVDRLVAYLRENMLGGVGMRVVRWYRLPVGFGRHLVLDQQIRNQNGDQATHVEKVKALAQEIVQKELLAVDSKDLLPYQTQGSA